MQQTVRRLLTGALPPKNYNPYSILTHNLYTRNTLIAYSSKEETKISRIITGRFLHLQEKRGYIVAMIRVEPSVLVFLAIISKTVNNQHFWKDLEKIFPKMYYG